MNRTSAKIRMPNKLVFEQVLECLRQGKCAIIAVKGSSMYPFIREGDRVLLKRFDLRDLNKGMIVLAKVNERMVLHRLVKFGKEAVWLAGDNNLVQHECVNYTDLVATAVSVYRGETEVRLNRRRWYYLGQAWYLARPCRRIMRKLTDKIF